MNQFIVVCISTIFLCRTSFSDTSETLDITLYSKTSQQTARDGEEVSFIKLNGVQIKTEPNEYFSTSKGMFVLVIDPTNGEVADSFGYDLTSYSVDVELANSLNAVNTDYIVAVVANYYSALSPTDPIESLNVLKSWGCSDVNNIQSDESFVFIGAANSQYSPQWTFCDKIREQAWALLYDLTIGIPFDNQSNEPTQKPTLLPTTSTNLYLTMYSKGADHDAINGESLSLFELNGLIIRTESNDYFSRSGGIFGLIINPNTGDIVRSFNYDTSDSDKDDQRDQALSRLLKQVKQDFIIAMIADSSAASSGTSLGDTLSVLYTYGCDADDLPRIRDGESFMFLGAANTDLWPQWMYCEKQSFRTSALWKEFELKLPFINSVSPTKAPTISPIPVPTYSPSTSPSLGPTAPTPSPTWITPDSLDMILYSKGYYQKAPSGIFTSFVEVNGERISTTSNAYFDGSKGVFGFIFDPVDGQMIDHFRYNTADDADLVDELELKLESITPNNIIALVANGDVATFPEPLGGVFDVLAAYGCNGVSSLSDRDVFIFIGTATTDFASQPSWTHCEKQVSQLQAIWYEVDIPLPVFD